MKRDETCQFSHTDGQFPQMSVVSIFTLAVSSLGVDWPELLQTTFLFVAPAVVVLFGAILLGIVIHALGYIAGAVVARCRVFEIGIGRHEKHIILWLCGVRIRFSYHPVAGYVHGLPLSTRFYRTRMFVLIAMGLAFSCAWLGFLWWYAQIAKFNPANPWELNTGHLKVAVVVQGGIFISNIRTEAVLLWRLIREPSPSEARYRRDFDWNEAQYLNAAGKNADYLKALNRIESTPLDSLPVAACFDWFQCFSHFDQWNAIVRGALSIIEHPRPGQCDGDRWLAANWMGRAVLYGQLNHARELALEKARRSSAGFDRIEDLKTTLGGLLFENGELDKAEPILRDVVEGDATPLERGIAAAFLSHIARMRGDAVGAGQLAQVAEENAKRDALVRRLLER